MREAGLLGFEIRILSRAIFLLRLEGHVSSDRVLLT